MNYNILINYSFHLIINRACRQTSFNSLHIECLQQQCKHDILFWFQYIIKSDIVIIPEVENSQRRRWPVALMLGLLLVSAVALAAAFLLKTNETGMYNMKDPAEQYESQLDELF